MTRSAKIFIGICTPLPLICGAIFYINYLLTFVLYMPKHAGQWASDPNPMASIQDMIHHVFSPAMIACLLISLLAYIGTLIFYIRHVARNRPKAEWELVMWILLFIFLSSIPKLVYFFLKVVPEGQQNEILRM